MSKPNFVQKMALRVLNRLESSDLAELIVGTQSASGKVINHETALAVATVYSCVRIIGETVGSLPLHVYKRLAGGGKERAFGHPLYDLLAYRPNPWQTSMEWREQMVEHLALRGNYYAAILRHGDSIIDDIIPLHPDRVTVSQLPDYSLLYEVQRPNGTKFVLRQEDVLHIRAMPGPDGITGRSVILHQRDLMGAALSTQEYSSRLFKNDATPGIVIKYPKTLSDEALKRLKASWNENYGGSANARKTAILEDGADIAKLSMTAEESQFIETKRLSRSEIAGLFRVPLILLQADQQTATFASAEQFMLSFMTHCIRPYLVRIEQSLHRNLFTAPRTYIPEFNAEGMLRGDVATRYKAYATGRQWGWLSANDVRERENMNPIEGGDIYLTPSNMVDANAKPEEESVVVPAVPVPEEDTNED